MRTSKIVKGRKIDEQHKLSPDADFVWIFNTGTEAIEVRFYGMVNAHITSEMI